MSGIFLYKDSLKSYINNFTERQYLIDGFLYEHSSLMLYAADGVGKSALTLQAILESSSNSYVFGYLKTSRPIKTLWIMAERHPDEIVERLKSMESMLNPNYENFSITTEIQGLNLLNEAAFSNALSIIKKRVDEMGGVDLIVVDPIYALVCGGLGKDENDSTVSRFSTSLQNLFNCSVIFVHHSNRGIKDKDTGKRLGEDMYGGRFLSAHFTGVYHITKTTMGTHFKRDKSSHKNLIEEFDLEFDFDTYISTFLDNSMQKRDKLLIELRRLKASDKWVTLDELSTGCQLSTQYLHKLFSRELNSVILKRPNAIGRKTLYCYNGS